MTQPSPEALTGPASILRRRWFWIALVAVLAVLGAAVGGTALAGRGELVNAARTVDAGPQGALGVDSALTSSRASNQGNGANGNQGNGQGNGVNGNQGNGQGNGANGNQGNGQGNGANGNQGNGNQGNGNQGNGNQGNGNQPVAEVPTQPAPGAPADGVIEVPPVVTQPSEDEDEVVPVQPELTVPGDGTPDRSETPADEPEDEPTEEPQAPVVAPQPAAVPVVAMGIAPGCVADRAVLVQEARNEDTKGVSVHFLANADFPASGSKSLTTAPDSSDRHTVTVQAASGKAYVGAGSIAVRTYRAGQTVGGTSYPAVSETRTLTYDAFTCEKPKVLTSVKARAENGRIVLAMYARNTGNTTLQVKFNPTAHFPGSESFALAPGAAKYVTVPTASAAVPATAVSVNVVSSVQGTRVALNQIATHDALSVAVPN